MIFDNSKSSYQFNLFFAASHNETVSYKTELFILSFYPNSHLRLFKWARLKEKIQALKSYFQSSICNNFGAASWISIMVSFCLSQSSAAAFCGSMYVLSLSLSLSALNSKYSIMHTLSYILSRSLLNKLITT